MELTLSSYKTMKGERLGYLTGILYLAAADASGVVNVCPNASPECKYTCLGHTSGRMGMPNAQNAQLRRTLLYHSNREKFLETIDTDIKAVVRRAKVKKLTPCFRLNGTSDLPWISKYFAERYPDLIYYDYTKLYRPWERCLPNYHITFSHSENNFDDCIAALKHNISVAVVFNTKKGYPLPEVWHGYKVIDGDETDLRFLDPPGVIVGLRAKGWAKKLEPGKFVQIAEAIDVKQMGS